VVEAPHRHQKRDETFHVRIDLDVPGAEILIKHSPSLHNAMAHIDTSERSKHLDADRDHKDIYVTIRDAFNIARRRLHDYARRLRGDVKIHTRESPFRADKLRGENLADA
jgi:hypothetical protein